MESEPVYAHVVKAWFQLIVTDKWAHVYIIKYHAILFVFIVVYIYLKKKTKSIPIIR